MGFSLTYKVSFSSVQHERFPAISFATGLTPEEQNSLQIGIYRDRRNLWTLHIGLHVWDKVAAMEPYSWMVLRSWWKAGVGDVCCMFTILLLGFC